MDMKLLSVITLALGLFCTPVIAQTNPGTSPLSGAKGGTNNAFMQFTGPASSLKTYTLPNSSDTIATIAASQTLTNKTINCANNTCSGLPVGGIAAIGAYTFIGNATSGSAVPSAVDIAALTTKASPASGDYVILSDQDASGAWKKASVSSISSAGSVSSIAGNTGAFTLSNGITNSTNDIRIDIGNLPGIASNTAASAGKVGETISSSVAVGSAVSIGSSSATVNVTSISVTAGDWDIFGSVCYSNTGSTPTILAGGISTTSATLPTAGALGYYQYSLAFTAGATDCPPTGTATFRFNTTTTVYLTALSTYSGSAPGAYGTITARRMR